MREPCHLAKIAGARSSSCPADIAVVACLSYSFGPSEEIVVASYPAAEEQKTIQEYQVGFLLVAVERTVEEPAADTFAVAVDSVRHTFAVAVVAAAAFVVEALVEEYTHSY